MTSPFVTDCVNHKFFEEKASFSRQKLPIHLKTKDRKNDNLTIYEIRDT